MALTGTCVPAAIVLAALKVASQKAEPPTFELSMHMAPLGKPPALDEKVTVPVGVSAGVMVLESATVAVQSNGSPGLGPALQVTMVSVARSSPGQT